jgi:uncharacterized membrane protein YfcA
MTGFSILTLALLFLAGLSAGIVDSIAGGGGLITLPALLGAGLPPHFALGTNKFQSSFGSFTASYYYVHSGEVTVKDAALGIFFTLIGSAAGAWGVQQVDGRALGYIIPFMLAAIIVYTLISPKLGEEDREPRMAINLFFLLFGLALGFYDGFFGPGVGSFWAIAFVSLAGFNFKKATAYTKLMNFTSNIVSFAVFLAGGVVLFFPGVVMAAGEIAGAKIGSELVIKKGARFVRPVFIIMVLLTMCKLFFDRFFR